MSIFKTTSICLLSSALIACGGGGGSSSSASSSTGQLSVDITDGPVESASEVVIAFTSIEVKPVDGDARTINFDETQQLNLLDYQGENFATLLDEEDLDAGDYDWMRLIIDDAQTYIVIGDTQHELTIPSGSQSGLKLNDGFNITGGQETQIMLDFELSKSVYQTGNGAYKMKPVIRQINLNDSETLSGIVATALIEDENCNNDPNNEVGNAVYLFANLDTTPQDIQGNDNDPISTANVSFDDEDQRYEFTLGFVPDGDYTLSFTCDAVLDDPTEADDDVIFSASLNVSIDGESESVTLN